MTRKRIAFAMSDGALERFFPAPRMARFADVADIVGVIDELESDAARQVLAGIDVLITGWGSPRIDASTLAAAPHLQAVLHAAGSVKAYVSEDLLGTGVRVSSAAAANAIPVAEYTVAMIVLANKAVLPIAAQYRAARTEFDAEAAHPTLGNYGKRVGIVGASMIGRRVIEMLQHYALDVVVYDPFLDADEATRLGATLVELDELMVTSNVVSVHAPSLPSTENLIDAGLIALMPAGATLINTARGEIIDQDALTERIVRGELYAVLDVTVPWTLEPQHPLYSSDRVLLTPHIAGSLGTELGRLADSVLDELIRLTADEPLQHDVPLQRFAITA